MTAPNSYHELLEYLTNNPFLWARAVGGKMRVFRKYKKSWAVCSLTSGRMCCKLRKSDDYQFYADGFVSVSVCGSATYYYATADDAAKACLAGEM